jgi:hypothetical protein
MFILKYMGSILKVEVPSEISIAADGGVQVHPLAVKRTEEIQDPMLAQIASAVGEAAASLDVDRRGRKPDPNSLLQRVFALCNKLRAEGEEDFYAIRAKAHVILSGEKSGKTINQYCYLWRSKQEDAA